MIASLLSRDNTVATRFSSRANSIGFFRWLMAFLVIFSHAGPIAGFYHGEDLGVQISDEQSLGGVAVAGFFFFSGFLITRSRRRTGVVRYFWRRCLRIMPAFWTALLLTAFVLAPIAWRRETGSMGGFWNADVDSPLTYVYQNMFLKLDQRNIAGMGSSVPFAKEGGYDWNGSAWTLQYEFKAYIMVGLIGLLGVLGYAASKWVSTFVAVGIIALNAMLWTGHVNIFTWDNLLSRVFGHSWLVDKVDAFLFAPFGHPFLGDPFNLMLLAPFAFGMLFALWGDKIPVSDVLAVVAIAVALFTYDQGGWNAGGQFGLLYFLMWGAIRWTRLQHWEKFGDFSYGVYIFAWPLMMFACYFGLQERGMLVYFAVLTIAVHAIAFCSWHLIEKPAMSLKDWSPAPVLAALRGRRSASAEPAAEPAEPAEPAAQASEPHHPSQGPGHHAAAGPALVPATATEEGL
ncbi:acyltransferase family protein [Nocardioides halotolerans]|uniref:acyltransferase family protein n=1 Tax=Nocardioides halotolerans TaxID=433660 RepID=UPI00041967A5|nr:acyltransferase [Nocardioides halotolerans]